MKKYLKSSFTSQTGQRVAKMYWCPDTQEFLIRLYAQSVLTPEADYFTNDETDARETASKMIDE